MLIFKRRGKYVAHRRFAQRAWLPPERECGLAVPALSTVEDCVVVGVQAPLQEGG